MTSETIAAVVPAKTAKGIQELRKAVIRKSRFEYTPTVSSVTADILANSLESQSVEELADDIIKQHKKK